MITSTVLVLGATGMDLDSRVELHEFAAVPTTDPVLACRGRKNWS